MIRNEFKRALLRKSTVFVFVVGVILGALEVFNNPVIHLTAKDYWDYPLGVYNWWSMYSTNMFQSTLITVFPLLAALAYSDSYIEDEKSGSLIHILVKYSKSKYLLIKYWVNFVIGGITVSVPLIINLFLYYMLTPNIKPNVFFGNPPVQVFLPDLYMNYPLLHILLKTIFCFIYGGIFASIGLALSIVIKNKYIVLFIPFVIYTLLDVIFSTLNIHQYSPLAFLFFDIPFNSIILVIAATSVVVFYMFFFIGGKHSEII